MLHDEYLKLKESTTHGDIFLPFTYYHTIMPDFFTSFPLHWHDEFELIYIDSGELSIKIDNINTTVKKGDIVLIRPGQLHGFKQVNDIPVDFNSLLFNFTTINGSSSDTCMVKYISPLAKGEYICPSIIHPKEDGYSKLLKHFREMQETYTKKEPFFEFELKSELYMFFSVLFTKFITKEKVVTGRNIDPTSNLKCIIEYINANYHKQITVKELAALIPLNEHYFMKYFKNNMGISCIEYLTEVRMNNAIRLLNDNALTIKMVGEKVGIPHASYFNRVFKSNFGMTPKEYRIANYNKREPR